MKSWTRRRHLTNAELKSALDASYRHAEFTVVSKHRENTHSDLDRIAAHAAQIQRGAPRSGAFRGRTRRRLPVWEGPWCQMAKLCGLAGLLITVGGAALGIEIAVLHVHSIASIALTMSTVLIYSCRYLVYLVFCLGDSSEARYRLIIRWITSQRRQQGRGAEHVGVKADPHLRDV